MPTWVGDVVMATPAVRAIRERFPDAHIALLIRPNARQVVADGPWMDEVIEWKPLRRGLGQIRDTMSLSRRLRSRGEQRFDWAILLSNAFRMAVVVWLARIPRRIGYARDGRSPLLTDRLAPRRVGREYEMISAVRYYAELAQSLGCEPPGEKLELYTAAAEEESVARRLEAWGLADHHPLVVVNPGASFGPSKLWLPERFADVADRLVETRGARIVITCGPGEEEIARAVHAAMRSEAHVYAEPRCSLAELKALIRRCDLLLNNDTGPRHFAKAFGRPVVTVFGSTYPEWTDTDYARERKIRVEVDCGPCHEKVCPHAHHKCMSGVTSDMVYKAACELLDGRRAGRSLPVASAK